MVDILDSNGSKIGEKPRQEIDKSIDLYLTVHIVLITPEQEVVVSKIPTRNDLPNLYAERWGTTAATIKRSGETASQAAIRCLARELNIEAKELDLFDLTNYTKDQEGKFYSAYILKHPLPKSFSQLDIQELKEISLSKLQEEVIQNPQKFAPQLIEIVKNFDYNLLS